MTRVELKGIGNYLPNNKVSNDYISTIMETSHEFIVERTGLIERRFADKDINCSDMGVFAGEKALLDAELDKEDIDCVIVNSLSPDYHDPAVACLIQEKLGLGNIPAFDIRAQCSGFVYGAQIAQSMIVSGTAKHVMVICSEVLSRRIDRSNDGRNISILLSDGAAAGIFSAAPNSVSDHIVDIDIGASGSAYDLLYTKSPGTSDGKFCEKSDIDNGQVYLRMKGRELFQDAVGKMCETVQKILHRNHLTLADIDLVVPHQPNLRILEAVSKRLGLQENKLYVTFERLGNMASASLPIAISKAKQEGRLQKSNYTLFIAYGSGTTWGSILYKRGEKND